MWLVEETFEIEKNVTVLCLLIFLVLLLICEAIFVRLTTYNSKEKSGFRRFLGINSNFVITRPSKGNYTVGRIRHLRMDLENQSIRSAVDNLLFRPQKADYE
jgi:hypothetical protein